MKRIKFEPNTYGTNELLTGKQFYVSFNARPCFGMGFLASDNCSSETALKHHKSDNFFVLNGDYRKEYLKVFPKGFKACLEVYRKNIKNKSSFSTGELK